MVVTLTVVPAWLRLRRETSDIEERARLGRRRPRVEA
jgi:hypothetical protein